MTSTPETGENIDAGTYEVLRGRLDARARELAARAESLNARRVETFGGQATRLLHTDRIRTANNCVPRDIAQVGGVLLFGYNVFVGLRTETAIADVFATHRFHDGAFHDDAKPGLLDDPRFEHDFAELYRYYRQTRLLQLRRVEDHLLAVFQTGQRADDLKVLRWRLGTDGSASYLDNRGDRDHVYPPKYDFEWTITGREQHVLGRHPHVSIENEVFVETVGGTLTVKIENNTEDGEGIFSEPVDEPLQSLADAEIAYARVGALILLRFLPYQETEHRYLVFNTRTKDVKRLDGIGQSCQRLPDDQGVIFPGGYYLATGTAKTFEADTADLEFERMIRSPNGEDALYVFHARVTGRYLLLPYNVIRKEVATPIAGHGYTLFDDGTLVVFRTLSDEPTRVHPMQVWQTPYMSETYAAAQPVGTGPLDRVGNADLVRGIADALSVTRMIAEMSPSGPVFEAIIAACTRLTDMYHWLADDELEDLAEPIDQVRATAEQVLDEFESVQALTAQAADAVATAEATVASLIGAARSGAPTSTGGWVSQLGVLRQEQGRLAGLHEIRYADLPRVEALEATLTEAVADTGRRAVEHLRRPDAFTEYETTVEELVAAAAAIATTAEAEPVAERLAEQFDGLQAVTEVIGGLDIGDPTVRVAILERLGSVLGGLNRGRATLESRRRDLAALEGRAEFAAEFALLGQAVSGALASADTPERCDDQMARLMARIETLETRFGEFADFAEQLATKRTEVYDAISGRRQALLDEQAARRDRLADSARRILSTVQRRTGELASADEINTYFAADPMVAKLRSLVGDLRTLGDAVRAEELDGALRAARQDAGRALRDKQDLYADGGRTIRLGRHAFAVNTQAIELTLVPHDGELAFSITGTDYREPVRDEAFRATREFWDRPLVSEDRATYRGEYLAAALLASSPAEVAAAVTDGTLRDLVRRFAESRFDEGYERGVHDADAAIILQALVRLRAAAGLLRYQPLVRAAAQMHWAFGVDPARRASFSLRASSLVRARDMFGSAGQPLADLCREISDDPLLGEYLVEELAAAPDGFATSAGARTLLDRFHRELGGTASAAGRQYADDVRELADPGAREQLVLAWLSAFREAKPDAGDISDLPEAVAIEVTGTALKRYDVSVTASEAVPGLVGVHPRISEGRLTVRLDDVLARTRHLRDEIAPAYRAYQRQRAALAATERDRLRLDEYQARVMTTFVRNRLLDEVYLPLIGDNLARQLGVSGTQSGMLLLISPPGYGKTTVMEYIADRLGLVFVKVNGPALGHGVTSLDPDEAPNVTARQEVEKISFALRMGTNVMLYLDDIQHTSPELLQRFISLSDAQRRIEGVWEGQTRTYDLRGKRFAVCMAGNPYTESGQAFRIPDMLANRADVWNLGDVLSGRQDLFELSYLENALTANPVLAPLAGRDRDDLPLLIRLAAGDESVRPDRLSHPYTAVELEQILSVLRKMRRAQAVVLAVNQAYIASAAQADSSRTEPPFRLQGSYRNMNKLAERIVPAMNEDELEVVIDDHYLGEAQTLAGGAEANLLKLAELRGRLTGASAARWGAVKDAYLRERSLGGPADDPLVRAVQAVGLLADRVRDVEKAIRSQADGA